MRTIMLCLNKLGIGGIETAVLNQAIQLIKRGFKVIVLADDGIYREEYEKEGVKFIKMEFSMQETEKKQKVEKIVQIIKDNEVEQVHIHQFETMYTVFPACMIANTPYVAYLHNSIKGVFDIYEKNYRCSKTIFKLYFQNAQKIIAIKEKTKQENMDKYKIEESKYKIIKNSINFDKFQVNGNKVPEKIEKFLIISRLSEEKEISLKNAITLFKKYYELNNNARLTIVGDGNIEDTIKNEIKDIKNVAKMLGKRNDIAKIMSEHDVVIGLDRCMLETITMKKIAVLSGYDNMKEIVKPENIETASNDNFGGKGLKENDIDQIVEELRKLNAEEIKEIVEKNYEYAYENLNSEKNIYIIEEPSNIKLNIDTKTAMESLVEMEELFAESLEYADKVYKDCKENQKWFEGQIENKDKEIEELKKSLENINRSKVWRFYKKIRGKIKK